MIKVSIIIPYRNNINYIFDALKSIFNQKKFKEYEIIIIYDDKKLYDLKKIKKFIKKKNNIKIIVNKKNLGAGQSRNIGINKSKGKYISFLDSDDYWDRNKLFIQYNCMEKKRLIFSHTQFKIINKDKKFLSYSKSKTIKNFNELIKSCDIGLSTVMIKSHFLKKNYLKFPRIKTKEDFVLWLRIAKKFKKKDQFYCIDRPLSNYRKLPNSLSSNLFLKFLNGYSVYRKYLKYNFFKSIYYLFVMSFNYVKKR